MSDDYTEIVVLCEDKQQWVFIRRFLIRSGIKSHRIRLRPYPAGQGSGEQFVREQYQNEVLAYRARANRMNIALIVMQDCDTNRVSSRKATLEAFEHREPDERIVLLFPRRNVETWIHFLTHGGQVDESRVYPKLAGRKSECWNAADHLAGKNDYTLTPDVPESLRTACPEIRRIFNGKRCIELEG